MDLQHEAPLLHMLAVGLVVTLAVMISMKVASPFLCASQCHPNTGDAHGLDLVLSAFVEANNLMSLADVSVQSWSMAC